MPEACAPGHMDLMLKQVEHAGNSHVSFPCFGNPEERQRFFFQKLYEVISSKKRGGILGKEKKMTKMDQFFWCNLSETPREICQTVRSERWPSRGVEVGGEDGGNTWVQIGW